MNSRQVLYLACALGFVGAALPLFAAVYLSWTMTLAQEERRLGEVGIQLVERTERILGNATEILRGVDDGAQIPCSPQHIAEMRRQTMNARSIEEIGYFESGVLRCTSWGAQVPEVRETPVDFTTEAGAGVNVAIAPAVTGGNTMMALRVGSYNALVDPMRLVDIVADPDMTFAIAHGDGPLIAARDKAGAALLQASGGLNGGSDEDHLISIQSRGEWRAIVAEPRAVLSGFLGRQLAMLLPIAALVAATIVGVVVWFSRRRLSPAGELAVAVQKREFVVHYQPIIELASGVCVGAEALVRWRRPDGGMVRPDHFIPLAEETGLILPITDQVVANVVNDLREVLAGDRTLHIAINFAPADMKGGRILEVIDSALAGTGIAAAQIWLEATERGFLDINAACETMVRARERGHSVAIDDFGTGYSSLQYLERLPLDALKIDKSFIDTIGRDTATSAVTDHIIEMARELNLFIVAEGIETREQLDYLVQRGVGFGQGWLFSKPLPGEEFIEFHRARKSSHGAAPEVMRRAAAA